MMPRTLKALYLGAITSLARRGQSRLVAAMARLATRPLGAASRAAPHRLLLLEKEGFIQDVEAAFDAREEVALWALPRDVPKAIAQAFLPPGIDDNDYRVGDPAIAPSKQRLRAFHEDFWRHYNRGGRFRAVLTGNFGYYAEREMAGALEALGTPFIALHKENLKSPGRSSFFEKVYRERRGAFTGRRIVVYNAFERELQVRAGIASPDKIVVAGMPRLDRIHAWRRQAAGTRPEAGVLFFTFPPTAGMPSLPRKGRVEGEVRLEQIAGFDELRLDRFCAEVHAAILACARDNPDLPVTIKTKGRVRDVREIMERLGVASGTELPRNLTLAHSGDVLGLIAHASLVCGFNSTALLEALAAGRPVVQPRFAEAAHAEQGRFSVDLGPSVTYAGSPEELAAMLAETALRREATPEALSAASLRALEDWVGNTDGKAGRRTADAVLSAIAGPDREAPP
jgi:hypothetical protein